MIKEAVILAAGSGTRLLPLTIDKPKCLVSLNGISFLENALNALCSVGVERVIIVVGYLENVLKDKCGSNWCGVEIEYLSNKEFLITNSMYSFLLALDLIEEDVWVLEADVFFEHKMLSLNNDADLTWLVDSNYRTSGGSFLEYNNQNQILSIEIVSDISNIRKGQAKSVGIFCVKAKILPIIRKWFKDAQMQRKTDRYYDLIFKEHIGGIDMVIHDIAPLLWSEIDTPEELTNAEKLFI